jgi:hypothetical protein
LKEHVSPHLGAVLDDHTKKALACGKGFFVALNLGTDHHFSAIKEPVGGVRVAA